MFALPGLPTAEETGRNSYSDFTVVWFRDKFLWSFSIFSIIFYFLVLPVYDHNVWGQLQSRRMSHNDIHNVLMTSLLHHPFPELCLCWLSEFIPLLHEHQIAGASWWHRQTPRKLIALQWTEEIFSYCQSSDCAWILLSLFPFCGWVFYCEL